MSLSITSRYAWLNRSHGASQGSQSQDGKMIIFQYARDAQLNRGAVGFSQPPDCIKVHIFSRNNIEGLSGSESDDRLVSGKLEIT